MGMYTGLRFKGIVKEEYRDVIDVLMNDETVDCWEDLLERFDNLEFAEDFIYRPRSSMIPFGGLAYMPDEWEEYINPELGDKWDNLRDADGWERSFNKETGYWQFQCSLKNYDGEIKSFVNVLLPVILEKSIYIESKYEESRYGFVYELVDGEMIENENKKVDYELWKDNDNCWY